MPPLRSPAPFISAAVPLALPFIIRLAAYIAGRRRPLSRSVALAFVYTYPFPPAPLVNIVPSRRSRSLVRSLARTTAAAAARYGRRYRILVTYTRALLRRRRSIIYVPARVKTSAL